MSRRLSSVCSVIVLALIGRSAAAETQPLRLPPLAATAPARSAHLETATFAGGCFWGVEGVFAHVKGVKRAVAGYSGGARTTADYDQVSTGATGHAEAVQVTFDPKLVSYPELLRIFFSVVLDPTEVDRQGPDAGSQYRSVVFTADRRQTAEARAYIAQIDGAHSFGRPIATRVTPAGAFYPAEAHHQDFMVHHADHPYIVAWDAPKVAALRTLFPEHWRSAAVSGA